MKQRAETWTTNARHLTAKFKDSTEGTSQNLSLVFENVNNGFRFFTIGTQKQILPSESQCRGKDSAFTDKSYCYISLNFSTLSDQRCMKQTPSSCVKEFHSTVRKATGIFPFRLVTWNCLFKAWLIGWHKVATGVYELTTFLVLCIVLIHQHARFEKFFPFGAQTLFGLKTFCFAVTRTSRQTEKGTVTHIQIFKWTSQSKKKKKKKKFHTNGKAHLLGGRSVTSEW